MTDLDLATRIDRIESQLAIQQLPIRYALAVDGRDLDAWLNLFVDDVDCGRHGRGRNALRGVIEPQLRTFYRSVHQICGHQITLLGPDQARGTVYCRAEHEVGDQWLVMAIAYFDEYARRDGLWYFVRRQEKHWYSVDVLERPAPPFHRWPANGGAARLPRDFPTWLSFWNDSPEPNVAAISTDPVKDSP
jgi:hypothetical protein